MSEPLPVTDPATDDSAEDLVDGRPGAGPPDRDHGVGDTTTLTTDDAAQDDDAIVQPGNS